MVEPAVDLSHATPPTSTPGHGPQGWLKYVWSTDHKVIAMQYMFTGMFMGLIGGFHGLRVPHAACPSPAWRSSATAWCHPGSTTPWSPTTARS